MTLKKKLRKIPNRAKQTARKIAYSILKRSMLSFMRARHPKTTFDVYPAALGPSHWLLHTEEWSRVIHRWEDRAAHRDGRPVLREDVVQDSTGRLNWHSPQEMTVHVPSGTADRWVYTYLDPRAVSLGDFEWHFSATRRSEFQELQFGFRYVNFYNRYRIRQEGGRIYYDVVSNGVFYNDLASKTFVMELGRRYDFVLKMVGKRFWLYVDGELVLEEYDFLNIFPRGSVAFILWESRESPEICASFSDIRIGCG